MGPALPPLATDGLPALRIGRGQPALSIPPVNVMICLTAVLTGGHSRVKISALTWPVLLKAILIVRRVRKIAKNYRQLRHVCPSAWITRLPLDGFSLNLIS